VSVVNTLLLNMTQPLFGRNRRFENRHRNESCYIFGNGVSIKEMDLSKLSDRISIGSTFLWIHKDFHHLNTPYYCGIAPKWFYPYWKHSTKNRYIRNYMQDMQRGLVKKHSEIDFFTSVTNAPGLFGNNIFYLHHFGINLIDENLFKMDGPFYFRGAVDVMIGMAIYMGFDSAYLIGCDYTHSPQRILHFYEKGRGYEVVDDKYNLDYFNVAKEHIDLFTVTTGDSTSKVLKSIDYEELTGVKPQFRENTELVDKEYLDTIAILDDYLIY
jgi:hypothetical protein